MASGILAPPQMQTWPPRWPPQTAAARNAPGREGSGEDGRWGEKGEEGGGKWDGEKERG